MLTLIFIAVVVAGGFWVANSNHPKAVAIRKWVERNIG